MHSRLYIQAASPCHMVYEFYGTRGKTRYVAGHEGSPIIMKLESLIVLKED